MHKAALLGVLVLSAATGAARAYEIRVRWVERVGGEDVVIPTVGGVQTITVEPGSTHDYRIQFGVFDTPGSPAPAGGFIGWNVGALNFTGGTTSNNNRIPPFSFAPPDPGNGTIIGGQDVTMIDATLGTQSGPWCFDFETHEPGPPPQPVLYGINTLLPVYTIRSVAGSSDYSATASGNQIVAFGWNVNSSPPDEFNPCVNVTFVPAVLPPVPFTSRLDIFVPSPSACALLALGGLAASCRRARRLTRPAGAGHGQP